MSSKKIHKPKIFSTTLLMCIFLGGAHRIYTGKIITGIVMLFCWINFWLMLIIGISIEVSNPDASGILVSLGLITLFVFFVWAVIDIVRIVRGKFKDSKGNALVKL